jgi:segregation and condensation protein A
MDYLVSLDSFHGPLDLLLYLVKRSEVDILDIPIAQIADQFFDFLQTLHEVNIELAGDFLVLAATLMEAKAKSLLPEEEHPDEEDEPDPRRELVRQLLEYRKFRDAASTLEERAEKQSTHLPRIAIHEPTPAEGPVVRSVEIWDLVSAFSRLIRETQAAQPTTVVVDETPQHHYEEQTLLRIQAEQRVPFRSLFTPPHHRSRLISLFLAVLELVRRGRIYLEQPEPFGEIVLIAPAPE